MTESAARRILPLRALASYWLKVAILAVVYHLAARLGLKMAFLQMNASPVWPPTGIALAALLLFGQNLWPGVMLSVLLGSLLTGAPPAIALGMALGNTLEALAGAYCLQHLVGFRNSMDRIRDVVGLALCSVPSTILGASVGTVTLMLAGAGEWQGFGPIWVTWWIGDLLGALVIAPVLLVWASAAPQRAKKGVYIEAAGLSLSLALVTWYVFSSPHPIGVFHQALIYLIFPFTIWAALRFGQRGATAATVLVSGIAIWGTVQGEGPLSLGTKNESLILLQTFLAVVSLTSQILAAATIERRKATEDLRQRVNDLATLNDSSQTFLNSMAIQALYETICGLAISRLGLDAAWIRVLAPDGWGASPAALCGIAPEAAARLEERGRLHPLHAGEASVVPELAEGTEPGYRSYGAFPLLFGDKLIGALHLASRSGSFFTQDRQLLIRSYANLAAVAIQNAWLLEEVRRGNRQLHGLSQRLMKAQEEERLHLSRELHDESGQLLAALMVQLGLLERDYGNPQAAHERLAELKGTASAIQRNLHQLAVDLRPASLDHLGLITALQQLVADFSRQHGIRAELEAVGLDAERLPSEVETTLYRIVQESLTNVALHARATRVDVLLSRRDRRVVAVVEDNGVGFTPVSLGMENHLGLFGMSERVEMLGGELAIESTLGKGTTVRVEVPCDDQNPGC
jgi:signal transduction histidine kinase